MYRERMLIHEYGQDNVEYIHACRLKDNILFNVPGLCESKSGTHILLTLQDEMGQVLFEASNSSTHHYGIIIAKAANIICRHMFSNEVSFNGDMSQGKQTASIPNWLLQMMTLIFGGVYVEDSNLQRFTHAAANLAQQIRFNSVKFKREDDVSDMRHSLKNESPFPVATALLVNTTTRKGVWSTS